MEHLLSEEPFSSDPYFSRGIPRESYEGLKVQRGQAKVVGVNCPLPPEWNRVNISSVSWGGGGGLPQTPCLNGPAEKLRNLSLYHSKKKYAAGFVTVNFEMVCIICTKDIKTKVDFSYQV